MPYEATREAGLTMTLMDVVFRYRIPPGERQMSALGCVREVYGVRKLFFDERERMVKVEYDASRLVEGDIAALLRGAGLDIDPMRSI
jgi:hypothetical protein